MKSNEVFVKEEMDEAQEQSNVPEIPKIEKDPIAR
jgi:hypothetical protein